MFRKFTPQGQLYQFQWDFHFFVFRHNYFFPHEHFHIYYVAFERDFQ